MSSEIRRETGAPAKVAVKKTDADALIEELRGQTIRLPDLTKFFRHWPSLRVNNNYGNLVPYVEDLIIRMEENPEKVEDYKKQDLAWFIAVWFPHADFTALKTLSLFVIWLFVWDDAVDVGKGGLAEDMNAANEHRAKTISVWEYHLYDEQHLGIVEPEVDRVNAIIGPLVEGLNYNSVQRLRFLETVKDYIRSCESEQYQRMEGLVPRYKDYIHLRLNTTAVNALCALADFVTGEEAPSKWFDSVATCIWRETNMGIILINDPISLKKELKTGCVINCVSALHAPGGNLQKAVDLVVEELALSINRFDTTVAAFGEGLEDDAERRLLERYADACRSMVVGTLHFSLRSTRYAVANDSKDDQSLEITL